MGSIIQAALLLASEVVFAMINWWRLVYIVLFGLLFLLACILPKTMERKEAQKRKVMKFAVNIIFPTCLGCCSY